MGADYVRFNTSPTLLRNRFFNSLGVFQSMQLYCLISKCSFFIWSFLHVKMTGTPLPIVLLSRMSRTNPAQAGTQMARNGPRATLCAFDLIEIDGEDLRWKPIEDRKAALKSLLSRSHPGIAFNKHFDVEGAVVFHHACKLGCEGIVSKRLGSPYRFGRSSDWLKVKNPGAPAVKRQAEEDWSTLGKRSR